MEDFYQLFVNELKDIYNAEMQIEKALPQMISAASSSQLKDAFRNHLKETKNQVKRLEEISREINENLRGTECNGMKGILEEGKGAITGSFHKDNIRDAALIGAAQRVEHYEIAVYGTLKAYAKHLKMNNAEKLLDQTLQEEYHADTLLSKLAEGSFFTSGINTKACDYECEPASAKSQRSSQKASQKPMKSRKSKR